MKYHRGGSWDLSCSTSLSTTWSGGEEGHLKEWPDGNIMQFSMDKRKVQQAGLSLLPPPQCYMLGMTVQGQLCRHSLGGCG